MPATHAADRKALLIAMDRLPWPNAWRGLAVSSATFSIVAIFLSGAASASILAGLVSISISVLILFTEAKVANFDSKLLLMETSISSAPRLPKSIVPTQLHAPWPFDSSSHCPLGVRTSENALRKEVNLLQKESRKLRDVILMPKPTGQSITLEPSSSHYSNYQIGRGGKRTRMQNHRTWNDDEQAR